MDVNPSTSIIAELDKYLRYIVEQTSFSQDYPEISIKIYSKEVF
jgi:hypothetical protein